MSDRKQEREDVTAVSEELPDAIVEETMKEICEDLAGAGNEKEEQEEHREEPQKEQKTPRRRRTGKRKAYSRGSAGRNDEDSMGYGTEQKEKKKTIKIIAAAAGAVCLVYLGFALFFINHFYFGTKINDVSFSGKTVEDVENYMKQQVSDYTLTIKEREEKSEQIKGADIELRYRNGKGVEEALKAQHPMLWISALFGGKSAEVTVEVDYNKEKLDQAMAALACMQEDSQAAPVDAQPVFTGEQFTIQDEVYGTKINQEQFPKVLHDYVGQFKNTLDLEKEKCYVMPKFKKDSPEVTTARDQMNGYLKTSVTYSVEPAAVVEKSLISQWLAVDADMNVVFSTDAVGAYIDELCQQYNTVQKVRTITTPTGKSAEVSGGSYGWKIDRDGEYEALVNNIKAGETVTREPVYAQRAAVHGAADWGSTYLEVDLSAQHMWYVVDGAVALETDVVTGVPVPARMTPPGVYSILEMMRNKTLRGDRRPDGSYEYETPVAYWMRVTWTGIGFHDASWQRAFGGELYKTGRGSHGCINMPVNLAGQLYGMLKVGTPVVIHY